MSLLLVHVLEHQEIVDDEDAHIGMIGVNNVDLALGLLGCEHVQIAVLRMISSLLL